MLLILGWFCYLLYSDGLQIRTPLVLLTAQPSTKKCSSPISFLYLLIGIMPQLSTLFPISAPPLILR